MANASCSTTATELDTKEISPKMKLVPLFNNAAMPKVISSTGISIYVWEVNSSTSRIITTAMTMTTCISASRLAESSAPVLPVTYRSYPARVSLTWARAWRLTSSSAAPSYVMENNAAPFW